MTGDYRKALKPASENSVGYRAIEQVIELK